MDNVEKRYCMIVECLAASDVYLASGRIAETLQVSAKTVRKDLEKMCPQLEEIGIYIRKKPGLGYFMDAESKAIWRSSEKTCLRKACTLQSNTALIIFFSGFYHLKHISKVRNLRKNFSYHR